MGRVNDTISNVNAAIRNLLLLVLVGGLGFGGYKAYQVYSVPNQKLAEKEKELADKSAELEKALNDISTQKKQIDDLGVEVAAKAAKIDRLEVSMRLLKVQHRLARLTVLDQHEVPPLNPAPPTAGTQATPSQPNLVTRVEFVEVNEEGKEIGQPKKFDINGDMIYIDYLHVTFDDKYIEQSDMQRSTSIALFQRMFGENQEPAKGFHLDTVGTRPAAYGRGAKTSPWEDRIWNEFWLIANEPARAAELGIHAAQETAVGIRARPGKVYEVELRSTGNMTIVPIERKKTPTPPST